jgi:hypothetical protein
MADPRKPEDQAPKDQDTPAPGLDPVHPANDPAVERDPATADPRHRSTTTVVNTGGRRTNLVVAAVVAFLIVIALLVFVNWQPADPQATLPADPAAVEDPAAPAEPAPADDAVAPAEDEAPAEEAVE